MQGQKTLDQHYNILGDLDPQPAKILSKALLKIGLHQGYCFTGRWYKVEASFCIVDHETVRIPHPIIFEKVGP